MSNYKSIINRVYSKLRVKGFTPYIFSVTRDWEHENIVTAGWRWGERRWGEMAWNPAFSGYQHVWSRQVIMALCPAISGAGIQRAEESLSSNAVTCPERSLSSDGVGALSPISQDAGMACAVCDSDGKGSCALQMLTQVPSFQKAESGFRLRWNVRVPNFSETLF